MLENNFLALFNLAKKLKNYNYNLVAQLIKRVAKKYSIPSNRNR